MDDLIAELIPGIDQKRNDIIVRILTGRDPDDQNLTVESLSNDEFQKVVKILLNLRHYGFSNTPVIIND